MAIGTSPQEPSGPTIYSVADAAGVSIATVSRVVQGTGAVSERTREKVLAAIDALDYMPVAAARSLAVRQHEALGLVLPELNGPYFSELLMGFEEAAAVLDLSVVLALVEPDRPLDAPRLTRLAAGVDGLAVLGGLLPEDTLRRAARHKPLVVLAGTRSEGVEHLAAENTASAAELTRHLLEAHARTRPVFVGDPDVAPDVRQRYEGFARALREHGMDVPAPLGGGLREEDGRAAAERLLATGLPADAAVCANDEVALALVERLVAARGPRPGRPRRHRVGRRDGRPVRAARPHHRPPARARARGPRGPPPPRAGHRADDRRPGGARDHRRPARLLRLPRAHPRHPHPLTDRPSHPHKEVRTSMRRTSSTALAIVATAALTLSACGRSDTGGGGATQGTDVASGKATGTITIWAMGAEGEKLPELAKDFEAQNPGAKVNVTAIPWDAAHDKFTTAITANSTPDAAMVGTTWMGEFAGLGALDPLPSNIDVNGFFPGAQKTTEVDGTAYGIPWYVETRLLFYRTDLAKKAGYDAAPTDWQGLHDMAKAMQDKAGAKWGIGLQAGGTGSWQSVMPFAWSEGAELSADGKYTFDTPEMKKAVDYYQSFFTDGISDKAAPAQPTTEPDFASGKVPMFISGPWMMSAVEKVGGRRLQGQVRRGQDPGREQGVLVVRRRVGLRRLQELQAARHRLEVRPVPRRPQDPGEVVRDLHRPPVGPVRLGRPGPLR